MTRNLIIIGLLSLYSSFLLATDNSLLNTTQTVLKEKYNSENLTFELSEKSITSYNQDGEISYLEEFQYLNEEWKLTRRDDFTQKNFPLKFESYSYETYNKDTYGEINGGSQTIFHTNNNNETEYITYKLFDSKSGQWAINDSTYNTYNQKHERISYTTDVYDTDGNIYLSYKEDSYFKEVNKNDSIYSYKKEAEEWLLSEIKKDYVYNSNDKLISFKTYKFNSNTGLMEMSAKTENLIDEFNITYSQEKYTWDETNQEWVGSNKTDMDKNGNIKYLNQYFWDHKTKEWKYSQVEYITETATKITKERYKTDPRNNVSELVPYITFVDEYDENGFLVKSSSTPGTHSETTMWNVIEIMFTNNEYGDPIIKASTNTNTELAYKRIDSLKNDYTYYEDGKIEVVTSQNWLSSSHEWLPSSRTTYFYEPYSSSSTSTKSVVNTINTKNIIYPNPASSTISFKDISEKSLVNIYNLSGQFVYHTKLAIINQQIDISNFVPGQYLIEIINDKEIIRTKLLKK